MIRKVVLIGFVVSLCLLTKVNGLKCMSCKGVANINECFHIVTCNDVVEQCFLDHTFLADSTPVFTAGCRAKHICDLIASVSGKRSVDKRASLQCAQCCAGNLSSTGVPCNGYLCNQKASTSNLSTCAICDQATDYRLCAVSQKCPSNEICGIHVFARAGHFVYKMGCETKSLCDAYLAGYHATHSKKQAHGDIQVCAACCTGSNCNRDNCFELIKNQTCYDKTVCGP